MVAQGGVEVELGAADAAVVLGRRFAGPDGLLGPGVAGLVGLVDDDGGGWEDAAVPGGEEVLAGGVDVAGVVVS